jgi:hypothetical protein
MTACAEYILPRPIMVVTDTLCNWIDVHRSRYGAAGPAIVIVTVLALPWWAILAVGHSPLAPWLLGIMVVIWLVWGALWGSQLPAQQLLLCRLADIIAAGYVAFARLAEVVDTPFSAGEETTSISPRSGAPPGTTERAPRPHITRIACRGATRTEAGHVPASLRTGDYGRRVTAM